MAAPSRTLLLVGLIGAVAWSANRKAKRLRKESLRGFSWGRRKKPAALKMTAVEREANETAREGQRKATRGYCTEGANMVRAAAEVADTPVIAYAKAIVNEACERHGVALADFPPSRRFKIKLSGIGRRRRRR